MAFALLGAALVGYGAFRQIEDGRAIARGEYAQVDPRFVIGLAGATMVLGVAVVVLVVIR